MKLFHYTDPVNADSIYRSGLLAHPMGEKHGENWLRDGFGIVVERPVVWLTSKFYVFICGNGKAPPRAASRARHEAEGSSPRADL